MFLSAFHPFFFLRQPHCHPFSPLLSAQSWLSYTFTSEGEFTPTTRRRKSTGLLSLCSCESQTCLTPWCWYWRWSQHRALVWWWPMGTCRPRELALTRTIHRSGEPCQVWCLNTQFGSETWHMRQVVLEALGKVGSRTVEYPLWFMIHCSSRTVLRDKNDTQGSIERDYGLHWPLWPRIMKRKCPFHGHLPQYESSPLYFPCESSL